MRTNRTTTLKVATLLLAATTLGTAGCDPIGFFSGNSNIAIIVPAGLGGNPGFYNPFGLTQALVNALIGAGSSGGDSSGDSGGTASASVNPNSGVLGALQPGYNGGANTNNLTGSAAATPPTGTTNNP